MFFDSSVPTKNDSFWTYPPQIGRIGNLPNHYLIKSIQPDNSIVYNIFDIGTPSRYSEYNIKQQDQAGCYSFELPNQPINKEKQKTFIQETIIQIGKDCAQLNNCSTLTVAMDYDGTLTIGQLGDSALLLITAQINKSGKKIYNCKSLTPSFNVEDLTKEEGIRILKEYPEILNKYKSLKKSFDVDKLPKEECMQILRTYNIIDRNYFCNKDSGEGIAYTRGLGGHNKSIPGYSYEPKIIQEDISKVQAESLVFLTDGMWDGAPSRLPGLIAYIKSYLNSSGTIKNLSQALYKRAYYCWPTQNEQGNREKPDNMTAQIVSLNKNNKFGILGFIADGAGDAKYKEEFASYVAARNIFGIFKNIANIKFIPSNDEIFKTISTELDLLDEQQKHPEEIKNMLQQINKCAVTLEHHRIANLIKNRKDFANKVFIENYSPASKYQMIKEIYDDIQLTHKWCCMRLIARLKDHNIPSFMVNNTYNNTSKSWIERYTISLQQKNLMSSLIKSFANKDSSLKPPPIQKLTTNYIETQIKKTFKKNDSIHNQVSQFLCIQNLRNQCNKIEYVYNRLLQTNVLYAHNKSFSIIEVLMLHINQVFEDRDDNNNDGILNEIIESYQNLCQYNINSIECKPIKETLIRNIIKDYKLQNELNNFFSNKFSNQFDLVEIMQAQNSEPPKTMAQLEFLLTKSQIYLNGSNVDVDLDSNLKKDLDLCKNELYAAKFNDEPLDFNWIEAICSLFTELHKYFNESPIYVHNSPITLFP